MHIAVKVNVQQLRSMLQTVDRLAITGEVELVLTDHTQGAGYLLQYSSDVVLAEQPVELLCWDSAEPE